MQKKKAMLAIIAVAIASLAIACGLVAFNVLKSALQVSVAETQLLYDLGSQETFAVENIAARVSEPIMELNDDRALRQAIYAFRRSQEDQSYLVAEKRAIVSLKLHRYLLAERGSQAHQSVAWDLIGILALEDAAEMLAWGGDTEKARQFIGESLEAFRSAVVVNSANPDAKRHLEFLLTLIEDGQVPNPGEGPATGDPNGGDDQGEDPGDGAGVNPPGTGY